MLVKGSKREMVGVMEASDKNRAEADTKVETCLYVFVYREKTCTVCVGR